MLSRHLPLTVQASYGCYALALGMALLTERSGMAVGLVVAGWALEMRSAWQARRRVHRDVALAATLGERTPTLKEGNRHA